MLRIKTVDDAVYIDYPPNGGWGWIVMVASFFVLGNAFGISKSLGIYFLDLKFEFHVNNSATSWISSLFLGAIGSAGFFTSLISPWMNARLRIMFGGLVASSGLMLMTFAPTIWFLYIGCFLAGTGHGIAFVSATSQVSLYFSTLRPLATGIMMSGSSVCAAVLPYLNNYILDQYGWRGSFLILSAISLNTCMFGALIRPIDIVPKDKITTGEAQNVESKQQTTDRMPLLCQYFCNFVSRYWVGLCLLGVALLLDLCFFVPNVFLVPLARSLGQTPDQSAMLLSLISIGDILCRPVNGILMSRIELLNKNILFYLSVLIMLMSLNQLLAAFGLEFGVLVLYTLAHGCLSGFVATTSVTAVPSLMGIKNLDKFYGIYFAAGSLSLLASAPLAGVFVDIFDDYHAAYWYCMICFCITSTACLIMYVIVKIRGAVVLDSKNVHVSVDSTKP